MDFFDKKDLVYLIVLWILVITTVFFAAKYNALKEKQESFGELLRERERGLLTTLYALSVCCTDTSPQGRGY